MPTGDHFQRMNTSLNHMLLTSKCFSPNILQTYLHRTISILTVLWKKFKGLIDGINNVFLMPPSQLLSDQHWIKSHCNQHHKSHISEFPSQTTLGNSFRRVITFIVISPSCNYVKFAFLFNIFIKIITIII